MIIKYSWGNSRNLKLNKVGGKWWQPHDHHVHTMPIIKLIEQELKKYFTSIVVKGIKFNEGDDRSDKKYYSIRIRFKDKADEIAFIASYNSIEISAKGLENEQFGIFYS